MRRRCWPVLLVLWPYAGILLAWVRQYGEYPLALWWIWLAGFVALCLANAVSALRRQKGTALIGMTVKLLLIPYYLLSLFLGMIILSISALPVILLVLLMNGLLLLSTSAYILRGVYLAWREKTLSAAWAIVLAISQCIFVLDVPGSIALYIYEKRRSR